MLKVLNLKGWTTINSQFANLMKILNRVLELQNLNLSEIKLDISAIQQLSAYIMKNETITKLTMANWGLMTNKAYTFARALIRNDSIWFLDLSHNNFGSDDYSIASWLGTMIKTHYYLLHLDLSHCKMSIEETMFIGLCVKASNQLMSLHLTGNTWHVYGRAFVRTLLESEPQYPLRRRQDIDSYITEGDTTLLMIFSNFYKQRIMPEEIHEFFVNGKTEVREIQVTACLDYIKVLERKIEETKVRLKDVQKPRIRFEDDKLKGEESAEDMNAYPTTNPLIRIYQDYMISYLK